MKVRILNYGTYGEGDNSVWVIRFPVGSVHEVYEFFPDTGEVDLGDGVYVNTFDPSEYEVVEE